MNLNQNLFWVLLCFPRLLMHPFHRARHIAFNILQDKLQQNWHCGNRGYISIKLREQGANWVLNKTKHHMAILGIPSLSASLFPVDQGSNLVCKFITESVHTLYLSYRSSVRPMKTTWQTSCSATPSLYVSVLLMCTQCSLTFVLVNYSPVTRDLSWHYIWFSNWLCKHETVMFTVLNKKKVFWLWLFWYKSLQARKNYRPLPRWL